MWINFFFVINQLVDYFGQFKDMVYIHVNKIDM